MTDSPFKVKNTLIDNTGFSTNSTLLTLGNSSVNVTMNSTNFSGTSNNSLYLGGDIASDYVNTTGTYTLFGVITLDGNVKIANAMICNGVMGSANQVVTSNGTVPYWVTVAPSCYTDTTNA